LKTLRLKGRVFSGKGEGETFIQLPWVRKQVTEKLGFTPYPGTLNLRLTGSDIRVNRSLRKANGLDILPAPGFCRGKLFKACLLGNLNCAVVIPEVGDYPENVIEVIASEDLKDTVGLRDGDEVEVKISL
jgi:riboflavin kinase